MRGRAPVIGQALAKPRTEGGEAVLGLRWQEKPSVQRAASAEEAAERAWAFLEEIQERWGPVSTTAADEVDERDWKAPQRTHQQRWNDRLAAMREEVDNFSAEDLKGCDVHFATANGKDIGVITSNPSSGPVIYVNDIMTHPGTTRQLGILLEFALKELCKGDNENKAIRLTAINGDSYHAYKAVGFEDSSVEHEEGIWPKQTLTPSASPLWTEVNGDWRLKKHLGQPIIG